MEYSIKVKSISTKVGTLPINNREVLFGIKEIDTEKMATPVDFFISSLGACILKNVERLARILDFKYTKAEVTISANRNTRPTSIGDIEYELNIYSKEKLKIELIQKNIENYGTIFNTIKQVCPIKGIIKNIEC